MMTSNTVIFENLSAKTTEEFMRNFFGTYGQILSLKLDKSNCSDIYARLTFAERQSVENLIAQCNRKIILGNVVNIYRDAEEFEPTHKHETMGNEENKELLAEIVFPIALDLYSNYAPKLTGMIIDAFDNLRNQEQYNQILSSREILIDLVHAAFQKYIDHLNKSNIKSVE